MLSLAFSNNFSQVVTFYLPVLYFSSSVTVHTDRQWRRSCRLEASAAARSSDGVRRRNVYCRSDWRRSPGPVRLRCRCLCSQYVCGTVSQFHPQKISPYFLFRTTLYNITQQNTCNSIIVIFNATSNKITYNTVEFCWLLL